jgi:hypothetical protein
LATVSGDFALSQPAMMSTAIAIAEVKAIRMLIPY